MTTLVRTVTAARWSHGPRDLRVALVPTMGYLHAGHVSLMRAARERADKVIVSLFVNPLQFGPGEDFATYPRDVRGDLAKCEAAGVDELFQPEASDFYPPGFQTSIELGPLTTSLCGARRPGHFRGVATVVYRLFLLLQPDVAFFGEKDFQQLKVIERMARDLGLPVSVVGCPIVREPDGLALSSRNTYLSVDERAGAPAIVRGLRAAQAAFAGGEREAAVLTGLCRKSLSEGKLREDYVALVHAETLEEVGKAELQSRLLVAAFAGKTRLIDNVQIG